MSWVAVLKVNLILWQKKGVSADTPLILLIQLQHRFD